MSEGRTPGLQVNLSLAAVSLDAGALQLQVGATVRELSLQLVQCAGGLRRADSRDTQRGQQGSTAGAAPLAEGLPLLPSPTSPASPLQQLQQHPPLACLTASWQSLDCSLAPAGAAQRAGGRGGAPAALALRCQLTDVSLQLGEASALEDGSRSSGSASQPDTGTAAPARLPEAATGRGTRTPQPVPSQLQLCLDGSVNAMHTSIGHEAVPGLLAALSTLRRPGPAQAAAQAAAADVPVVAPPPAEAESSSVSANGEQGGGAAPPVAGGRRPPRLAEWQVRLRLGQGSSLRFVDAGGAEQWVSSIEVARLVAAQQAQQQGGAVTRTAGPSASGDAAGAAAGRLAVEFEVQQIEMHAVHTMHADAAQQVQQGALQQVLATRLLRFHLQPPTQAGKESQLAAEQLQGELI